MTSLSVVLLSVLAATAGPQDSLRFSVQPARVAIGDTVTLSWEAPGATSVFITGVGRVQPAGTARLVPVRPETTYVLSAEYPGRLDVRAGTVRVDGARGDGPDVAQMHFPYSTRCAPLTRSVNRVVERVHAFFQDSLLVESQERVGPLREVILETRAGSQRVVPAAPERRIRARRVFYRVRVARAGEDQVVCSVSSNVQFQRAGESTWYPEPADSELHALAARYLMQRIRNE